VLGVAILLLFLAPVVLFGISSNWTFQPSREGGRYLSRWNWGTCAIEIVCALTVVVFGVASQPWIWLPISSVAMGAAFTAIAVLLGRALRSVPIGPAVETSSEIVLGPWSPARTKRGLRGPLIVIGACFVATGVAVLALHPWSAPGSGHFVRAYASFATAGALPFGFFVGTFVCAIWSIPLASRMRKVVPRSFTSTKRIGRAVARGDATELSEAELEVARRFAAESVLAQPWVFAQYSLLFLGVIGEQVSYLFFPIVFFGPWLIGLLVLIYIPLLVLIALRTRRARRFLEANGEPTPSPELVPTT
jgi:hypothetical protein